MNYKKQIEHTRVMLSNLLAQTYVLLLKQESMLVASDTSTKQVKYLKMKTIDE